MCDEGEDGTQPDKLFQQVEDAEHFLLHCNGMAEERKEMVRSLPDQATASKHSQTPKLSQCTMAL